MIVASLWEAPIRQSNQSSWCITHTPLTSHRTCIQVLPNQWINEWNESMNETNQWMKQQLRCRLPVSTVLPCMGPFSRSDQSEQNLEWCNLSVPYMLGITRLINGHKCHGTKFGSSKLYQVCHLNLLWIYSMYSVRILWGLYYREIVRLHVNVPLPSLFCWRFSWNFTPSVIRSIVRLIMFKIHMNCLKLLFT